MILLCIFGAEQGWNGVENMRAWHPRYSHAPNGRYGSGRYGYGHEMGWDGMGTSSHGTQFQLQARPEILDLIGVGGVFF
jgi:hypothetical protein